MNAYRIALRMLWRDWRGGELGVLLAALIVAVAMVSGISAFTSRLQASLEQESHRFLAADLVLRSPREVPAEWLQKANQLGLRSAEILSFPSMLSLGDDMQLASVKAVSSAYPLRGELMMSRQPFGTPEAVSKGPPLGEVWLDSRLFPLLNVEVGDSIVIGDLSLKVSAAIRSEPDRASGLIGFGPRALLHLDDIPATGVVQLGSRVSYRYLFAGTPALIAEYSHWLEPQLSPSHNLVDVAGGQPRIAQSLERSEGFLLLAGSLGVVLAGVAIALAARRFSERHYNHVAILKSLGATESQINSLYFFSLLVLGIVATVLGWLLGWGLQQGFMRIFEAYLPDIETGPGLRPFVIGGVTGLVCLFVYAWPPLKRLGSASPLRVLRRDLPGEDMRGIGDYLIGLLAIVLLMRWYSGSTELTLGVLAGISLAVSVVGGVATLLLRGSREVGMKAGSIWRLALSGLQRRGRDNAIQVVIFSLAIMLLLILVLVRTSIIEEWQLQLPQGTPNHFMLNIAPGEDVAVGRLLDTAQIDRQPLYPMVRGRVTHVADQTLAERQPDDDEVLDWELNMTWSEDLPPGNEIVAGQWWQESAELPQVSIEREAAARLNIGVGEQIRFLIGSREIIAEVSSLRSLDWRSLQPNFYIVFEPGALDTFPATYMTSFYLDPENKLLLNDLIRAHPTITVLEMDLVISQIKSIIDQVTRAIELVLSVILVAGALVLVAGVQSSLDTRLEESAIIRTLGGSSKLILGSLVIEFGVLGLIAGALASVGAEAAVYVIQREVFEMPYVSHPWLALLGPLCGVVIIGLVGVFSCRKVVNTPPIYVLRGL
ncbi:MAG: putative ABC transport system permease protein [Halieaceae bacterium]|jgi:putative ABC transport system permease protein